MRSYTDSKTKNARVIQAMLWVRQAKINRDFERSTELFLKFSDMFGLSPTEQMAFAVMINL